MSFLGWKGYSKRKVLQCFLKRDRFNRQTYWVQHVLDKIPTALSLVSTVLLKGWYRVFQTPRGVRYASNFPCSGTCINNKMVWCGKFFVPCISTCLNNFYYTCSLDVIGILMCSWQRHLNIAKLVLITREFWILGKQTHQLHSTPHWWKWLRVCSLLHTDTCLHLTDSHLLL